MRWLALLAAAAASYVAVMSALVLFTWSTSKGKPSDTIIVLGAAVWNGQPSPALRERLDVALQLWKDGMAGSVIASGGVGLEPVSEGEVMKRWLVERGVPAEVIHVEDRSVNTYENLTFSQDIMKRHGMESAILVTHGFHSLRSSLQARAIGLDATVEPVQIRPEALVYYTLRECAGIAYLLASTSVKTLQGS